MSRYALKPWRGSAAPTIRLRPDMAQQLADAGDKLSPGRAWALWDGGRLLGIGGLSPVGAAEANGWLLVGDDLTTRDWAEAVRAMRLAFGQARGWRTVRRIRALATGGHAEARRLLERVGFRVEGEEDGDVVMTMELRP